MNSRERVLAAMSGGTPDRVPVALGSFRIDLEELGPADEAERLRNHVDVRFVSFQPSKEQQDFERYVRSLPRDTRVGGPALLRTYQEWRYQPDKMERNPLAEAEKPEDLESYPWPDVTAAYRHAGLAGEVATLHHQGFAVAATLPHLGGELFETSWRLRGFQNFLFDLLERGELAEALLDRLLAIAQSNAVAVASASVDVLVLDDDVGMPGGMIISPETWHFYLKPRLATLIEAARETRPEIRILYHSDGVIAPIIPELMEIGVDAINPVQPDRMDCEAIRRKFGVCLCLWGTVGVQTFFSFASPVQVREEVRHRVESLGKRGLVLCPAYDIDEPDVPWGNVVAFLEAAREYG